MPPVDVVHLAASLLEHFIGADVAARLRACLRFLTPLTVRVAQHADAHVA
ncbi:MAG TPA: hypothetical protein VF308_01340 [Caldimonas sp.]